MAATLASMFDVGLSYADPARKKAFHTAARRALNRVAAELGLSKGQYEIRVNKGGIAVSGEVTLHTDPVVRGDINATDWREDGLYVQVSQSCLGKGREVMYRLCKSRADYTGGQNHFVSADTLDDPQRFADILRRAVASGR